MSDEIYARIYYGDAPCAPSIFSQPGMAERTVIINGFSKFYSMDGWRLGWTVASPEITRHLLKIRQYTTVCVNTFIQHGAARGVLEDQAPMEAMTSEFDKRRRVISEGLRAIEGVTLAEPTGAFLCVPEREGFWGYLGRGGGLSSERTRHRHGERCRFRWRRIPQNRIFVLDGRMRARRGASGRSIGAASKRLS